MQNLTLSNIALFWLVLVGSVVSALPRGSTIKRVFNYNGQLPIKDDRTGQLIKGNSNETETVTLPFDQEEAEAACWKLIQDESVVTFALQNKVLNDLINEMKDIKIEDDLRESIEKAVKQMQDNMNLASDALKKNSAEEFFDALFDSSEDIIHLAGFLRNPQLDDNVFLVLVKAVSRLGRNNAALIQEFSEMCSFAKRFPKRVSRSD